MAYRAADNPDRAKAIGGVLLVHIGLAAIILSGLSVHNVRETVERLKTFDIREVPPSPRPLRPEANHARARPGAPGKKALATAVVAPQPSIVIPSQSPLVAAPVASTGSAPSSGAAAAGNGSGAGGSGSGRGGGGAGDFTGYTPARMLNKIPDHEYRRISGGRIPTGSARITFRVNVDGRLSNCRIARSSGDPAVDAIVCDAAIRYLRFSPARNRDGHAIAEDIAYTQTWRPNF